MSDFVYEDKSDDLEEILSKYRSKWHLDALAWLDYSDVCQIIRIHIFEKWHLWDQKRSFKPWAAMVISNQIKNLIRNNYSNFAKPCLKCDHNMGGTGCATNKSQIQDGECGIYAKWQKKKERAYNLKLALPIDGNFPMGEVKMEDNINFDKSETRLHELIALRLNEKHRKVYHMLYVENVDEAEVARIFKFKKDSSKRKTIRYKQINNLKKKFYAIAKDILQEEDIL